MSNEKGVVSLQLTQKMINEAASPAAILSLPAVQHNWIEKYNLAAGNNMGAQAYELEKMLFAQRINDTPKLQECDRFTLYAAWMMHGISGLTFRDDQAYIVPFKGKAVWQPGWKGRLAQIQQWPTVVSTTEPQIVYDCDQFEFETTMDGKRLTKPHVTKFPRPANAQMIYVFMIIKYISHTELYTMDRDEVNQIRDQYSESYKYYMSKGGKWPGGAEMDKPLALSNPQQYWRKTLVKRIYNNNSNAKTAAQKVLDSQITKADILGDDIGDNLQFTAAVQTMPTEADFKDALLVGGQGNENVPDGGDMQMQDSQGPVKEEVTPAPDNTGSEKESVIYTETPPEVKQAIAGAKTKKEVLAIWKACEILQQYDFFKSDLKAKENELDNAVSTEQQSPTQEPEIVDETLEAQTAPVVGEPIPAANEATSNTPDVDDFLSI